MFTSCPHLYLAIFDQGSAALFKAFVQVLRGDDDTCSWGQGLNFKASIFDLSQHLLNRRDLVDDIEMVSTINIHMESACKLLRRMNESLKSQIWHLKSFRQGIGFRVEHRGSHFDHVVLELLLNDLDLAWSSIMQTKSRRFLQRLQRFGNLSSWIIEPLSLDSQLLSGLNGCSILCDLIHLSVDFPIVCLSCILIIFVIFIDISRQHPFASNHGEDPSQLPCFDLASEEIFLFLSYLRMNLWTGIFLVFLADL